MDMGPLELIFSWQAGLAAIACVGVMAMTKAVLDVTYGRERRRKNPWMSRVILPAAVVLIGALYAAIVPLRPEFLIEWVEARVEGGLMQTLSYAMWGAACGQFSDYLYMKLEAAIGKAPTGSPTSRPPGA